MNQVYNNTASIIYNKFLQFYNHDFPLDQVFELFINSEINNINNIILDNFNQNYIEQLSFYVFDFILQNLFINNNEVHYYQILNNDYSILFNKLCIYYNLY